MKIERLLAIVVYLLNRDMVNASTLAEKFEVSVRTIQRDMESLSLAGIPIVAVQGSSGGYGILDSFKLHRQITKAEDYRFIITALMGMNSAYQNKKLETTLEKLLSVAGQEKSIGANIKLDFSVSREGRSTDEYIRLIEKAAAEERRIEFEYTNAYGEHSMRLVEPVGAIYKWYAWYLLGYCCQKQDYRMFKLARIRNLQLLNMTFSQKHESLEVLSAGAEKQDRRRYLQVKLLCKAEIRVSAEEYFPNALITESETGDFVMKFAAPASEIGWKGLLFTYGNQIRILEPEELKEELAAKAKEIMNLYI